MRKHEFSPRHYVADTGNASIRLIEPDGTVSTVAAIGSKWSFLPNGASLPNGVAVDSGGMVYVADSGRHAIARIDPGGGLSFLAGQVLGPGAFDGPATAALFNQPAGLAADAAGNLYVADSLNHTVRRLDPSGTVTTVAGMAGTAGSSDGTGSAARFNYPAALSVDATGNIYVADRHNFTIRRITPGGAVTTWAGTAGQRGSVNGTGRTARFYDPVALAVDSAGNVYVADDQSIRCIDLGAVVTTLAGHPGIGGYADGTGQAARFNGPAGLAVDRAGNLYVADSGNYSIRQVAPGGQVSTVAGKAGNSGISDGTGSDARFLAPAGLAVDGAGNIYVYDWGTVRRLGPDGVVQTLVGTAGQFGSADGAGTAAQFDYTPFFATGLKGMAVGPTGIVYLADSGNNSIRRVTRTCPDAPVIDQSVGPVGVARQLDTRPQTAVRWDWRPIRWPAASHATLSDAHNRNPVFTPDLPDVYMLQLRATDAAGGLAISNLTFRAQAPSPPRLYYLRSGQQLRLFWATGNGFFLERANTLGPGAVWTPILPATTNAVTFTLPGSAPQFFRLRD